VGTADEVLKAYGITCRTVGLDDGKVDDDIDVIEPLGDIGALDILCPAEFYLNPVVVLKSDDLSAGILSRLFYP